MLNYLSLLGWNDGSEQEIYSVEELQKAFSLERITKSAAGAAPGGSWCQHSMQRGGWLLFLAAHGARSGWLWHSTPLESSCVPTHTLAPHPPCIPSV